MDGVLGVLKEVDEARKADWNPFSPESDDWHTCPGHEWRRFSVRNGDHAELVTRCEVCGAPRCDSFYVPKRFQSVWKRVNDHAKQGYRCTQERHHREDHDYLNGMRVPLGG